MTLVALNVDLASAWSFGDTEELVEDDGEEVLETTTVYESAGPIALANPEDASDGPLSTLDSAFSDATIRDLDDGVMLASGEVVAVYYEILVTSDEESALEEGYSPTSG